MSDIAVFSTVSLGGASSLASFAGGYDRGLVAGAFIAAGFALVALVTFPSFKPTEIQQVSVH